MAADSIVESVKETVKEKVELVKAHAPEVVKTGVETVKAAQNVVAGAREELKKTLKRRGIEVSRDDSRLDTLIAMVKEREAEGYAYEGADASFELLARRTLGTVPDFFSV